MLSCGIKLIGEISVLQNRRTWLFSSRTKIFASTVFHAMETRLNPEIRNLVMNLRITTDEKVGLAWLKRLNYLV